MKGIMAVGVYPDPLYTANSKPVCRPKRPEAMKTRPTRHRPSPYCFQSREEVLAFASRMPVAGYVLSALRLHTTKEKGARQPAVLKVVVSIKQLMATTGLSDRTVRRALSFLEDEGYLRKSRTRRGQTFSYMFGRGTTGPLPESPVTHDRTSPVTPDRTLRSRMT